MPSTYCTNLAYARFMSEMYRIIDSLLCITTGTQRNNQIVIKHLNVLTHSVFAARV